VPPLLRALFRSSRAILRFAAKTPLDDFWSFWSVVVALIELFEALGVAFAPASSPRSSARSSRLLQVQDRYRLLCERKESAVFDSLQATVVSSAERR
jgi:hypothetical protein